MLSELDADCMDGIFITIINQEIILIANFLNN